MEGLVFVLPFLSIKQLELLTSRTNSYQDVDVSYFLHVLFISTRTILIYGKKPFLRRYGVPAPNHPCLYQTQQDISYKSNSYYYCKEVYNLPNKILQRAKHRTLHL